jgi:hypothetical protein
MSVGSSASVNLWHATVNCATTEGAAFSGNSAVLNGTITNSGTAIAVSSVSATVTAPQTPDQTLYG